MSSTLQKIRKKCKKHQRELLINCKKKKKRNPVEDIIQHYIKPWQIDKTKRKMVFLREAPRFCHLAGNDKWKSVERNLTKTKRKKKILSSFYHLLLFHFSSFFLFHKAIRKLKMKKNIKKKKNQKVWEKHTPSASKFKLNFKFLNLYILGQVLSRWHGPEFFEIVTSRD